MASQLATIIADFQTQLATELTIGGTTATLQSATDDDGVSLPAGRYFFTIDGDNSQKEHISCSLSGTSLTGIKTVSRQGVETSGVLRKHRVGATVTITDFKHIKALNDLLNGTTDLDASTPLEYDGTASITTANQLATKAYVDGVAIAGGPDASASVKGISKLSTAPASPTDPIAVGTNDTRMPTQGENDALAGSSGIPSSTNKYITEDDVAENTASKVVRRKSNSNVTVPTTPTDTTDATSKSYVDTTTGVVDTTSYVLGESFTGATTPQPCTVIDDLYQYGIGGGANTSENIYNFDTTDYYFGESTQQQRAVRIIPRRNVTINLVIVQLAKKGTPTDNVSIEIQTDSSGVPSGTPVTNGTSSTVGGGSLSSTVFQYTTLTFSTPPALVANTTYWVVFKRSSSLSGTDFYVTPGLSSDNAYGSFIGARNNGSWSASSQMIPFMRLVPATGSSLSLWQCDSDSTIWIRRQFFGFCTTTGSAGDNATLVKSGVLGGFSSLNIGTDYTTSTTAGSITNSIVSGVYVGTAISATQMSIPKIKYGDPHYVSPLTPCGGSANPLSGGTGVPQIQIPYNGIFTFYWDTTGSGMSGASVYISRNLVYKLDSAGAADETKVIPYSRGQLISFVASPTGGELYIRFTPIIE